MVRRLIHGASYLMSLLATIVLFCIMVIACVDITRRLAGFGSLRGAFEYSEVLLVWLVYLSIAHTQRMKDHVAVDLVTNRLPPRLSAIVQALGLIAVLGLFAWMAWAGVGEALASVQLGEVRPGLVRVPLWPARIILAAGIALLVLELLIDIHDQIRGIADPQYRSPDKRVIRAEEML
jgi:TRAP-type C4-dicarboxylate transport system permease small subunit